MIDFIFSNFLNLLIGFPSQRPGGLLLSIWLAILGVGFGFVLGSLLALGSIAKWRLLRWFSQLFVNLMRGLPLILLLVLIHTAGGRLGLNFPARRSAVIALALFSGAYQSEIIRAGLQAVPKQLLETSRMLGNSQSRTLLFVWLPHAVRLMAPALTNQSISLFKDTSVVIILGVAELMTTARIALGSDINNAPYWVALYLTVGGLYFTVAFLLSRYVQRWENEYQIVSIQQGM